MGPLHYELHPGLVLVALHLVGVPPVMCESWQAPEDMAAWQQLIESGLQVLRLGKAHNSLTFPAGMSEAEIPTLMDGYQEYCRIETAPSHFWLENGTDEPTMVGRMWLPATIAPVLFPDKSAYADGFGHRCLFQCEHTTQCWPKSKSVDLWDEFAKIGVYAASTANTLTIDGKQRATVDLVLALGKARP